MGRQSLHGQEVDHYGVLPQKVEEMGVSPARVPPVEVAMAYQTHALHTQPPQGRCTLAKTISSRRR